MDRPKVLIVEDDVLLQIITLEVVEDCGCRGLVASGADEANAMLDAHEDIALLLTDVTMPGSIDGLQLAHIVRRSRPHVGIIIVSGKHRFEEHEIPEGSLFIGKPFEIENMQRVIRRKVTA